LADGERSHVGLCIALAEKMVEGDLAILAGGGVGPDTIQTSERGQISLKIICPGDATRPEVPGAQRALHNLINFLPMLMCLEPIGSEAGSLLSIEIRSVTTEGAKEALPRQAVAEIDIFYQPSVEYFAILEEIHRFRSAYRCKELRIEMTHHKPAAKAPYLPGEVEALRRAVQVVRKKEPIFGGSILPLGLAGLVEEKIPAIGYGYNSAAAAYLPDETVEMNLLSEYSLTLALGILNMQGLYKSEDFDQAEEIPITTAIQPVRSPEKPMPQTLSLEESIMANITAALPSSRPEPAAKVQLLQDQDLFSPQSSEPEPVSSIKIHPLTSHPAAKIEPSIDPLTLSTELRNQVKLQRGQKSRPGQDTKTPSLFEPEQFELGFRSLDNTEPATAASSEPGKQPPPATTKPPQGYKPLDITLGDDQPDTKTLLNLDGSEENSNGELFPGGSSLYSRHPNRHPNPYRGKI